MLHTSHHTHYVIGSGAGDPQKYDPTASRETLDHSIPYIFAVALQDGGWHHVDSYLPARAARPDTVELWHKITTAEDAEWTRRYHSEDPDEKAFGGRVEIQLTNGETLVDEIAVADAHPLGARPFARDDYIRKFRTLAEPVLEAAEIERFLDAGPAPARADGRRGSAADHRGDTRRPRRCPRPEGPLLMLYSTTPAAEKRRLFRERLATGELLRFPGAFNPLSARLIERKGFEGVYISGAVLAADLGLPTSG